jgi:non-ribosomal peptide synthetase component F
VTSLRTTSPPLSVAQEGLWYQHRLTPNRLDYNELISIDKHGPLDPDALRRAFTELLRRHEAWRTTFEMIEGEPVQSVQPVPRVALPVMDLSDLAPEQAELQAARHASNVARVPYDLGRGPLVRPRLFKLGPDRHRLALAMHHVVFDGGCLSRVVLPELAELYDADRAGRPPGLPEPPTRYADYARWEREWIDGPIASRRLEHWRRRLAGAPSPLLPHDRPRPARRRFRGGVVALTVSADSAARLREVGQRMGATPFQVMACGWAILLGRYSGQDDVVFATATDLRQRREFETVVGYCVTPLVLRVDLTDDPRVADLIVQVRNELLDGLDNLVPFERVLRSLRHGRVENANPIFQTMIVVEPQYRPSDPTWSMHRLKVEGEELVGGVRVDLELQLEERPDGSVQGRLIYDSDLYEHTTAQRTAGHWSRVIEAVIADPTLPISALPILTEQESRRQLVEWNATRSLTPPRTLHDLVRETCTEHGDWPAVIDDETLSYAELRERSKTIARRLTQAGVGPGDRVALLGEPSARLIAAVLGVAAAGGAYLLLDPELEPPMLEQIIRDAGIGTVLAEPHAAERLDTQATVVALNPSGRHDGDGYGPSQPGGDAPRPIFCLQICDADPGQSAVVAIRQTSAANVACAIAAEVGLGSADAVLVLPSGFWEASVIDLWAPLSVGARLVVAPVAAARDGAAVSRLIKEHGVSFLHATPAVWQTLVDTGLRPARGLRAMTSGQPLSPGLADELLGRCQVVWNAYGCAETTFCATVGQVTSTEPVSIGRPIANTRVYVVDRHDAPVPVGAFGELLVAGEAVVGSYVGQPECSARAFRADPYGDGTAYRTGERARWLSDGTVALSPEPARSRQAD